MGNLKSKAVVVMLILCGINAGFIVYKACQINQIWLDEFEKTLKYQQSFYLDQ